MVLISYGKDEQGCFCCLCALIVIGLVLIGYSAYDPDLLTWGVVLFMGGGFALCGMAGGLRKRGTGR